MPFVHIDLVNSKKEIRILTLISSHPLTGRLDVVPLDTDQLDCVALSYTWNDPINGCQTNALEVAYTDRIELDGQPLNIKHNLCCALEHLIERNFVRVWADAICINQTNSDERNNQVALMGSIYTKASKVIVWLGRRSANSDLAMDHLMSLARVSKEENQSAAILTFANANCFDAWQALLDLLHRNWWKRAWVIQEFVLAKTIEIACGDRILFEEQLLQAQEILAKYWFLLFPTDVVRRTGMTSRDLERMLILVRIRTFWRSGGVPDILAILRITRESVGTDYRDLLFAKYGLMDEHARALFAPDYTTSFQTVFKDFAHSYIRLRCDLSILSFAGISEFQRQERLPSWVPHWGPHKPAYPLLCSWENNEAEWPAYKAAGSTLPSVQVLLDGNVLRAVGFLVDSVDGMQFDPWCIPGSGGIPEGRQSTSTRAAFCSSAETFEALYRTLVADTCRREPPLKPCQALPEFGPLLAKALHDAEFNLMEWEESSDLPISTLQGASNIEKRWHGMRHLKVGGVSLRDILKNSYQSYLDSRKITERRCSELHYWHEFEHSLGQAMYHRRVFTTTRGHIGIGTRILKPKDQIIILKGCPIPLIVRPVPYSELHEVVGECYIHGIMYEECVQQLDEYDPVSFSFV
ncbi:unnamed protein product [Periconia digitata]|uniref:Heterokaryon incompatibility domain-containing protein n=1 Tax=Periconia digitata TaxID=1303443 RepID=A0A9W4XT19_9PLEO|nr:unnamed protein product [Periconia digitata]